MVCAFNALRMVLKLLPITYPYLQSYHNNSSQQFIVIAIHFLIKCGNQRTKCHDREIDDISKDALMNQADIKCCNTLYTYVADNDSN